MNRRRSPSPAGSGEVIALHKPWGYLSQFTPDGSRLMMVTNRAQNNQLEAVILHEMGHVLGIGTLWSTLGFLQDPVQDTAQSPRPDTHFTGPLAIAAFDALGGAGRTSGAKVPVENQSNSFGSLNGHWRETTMDRELMTPFLDGGVANPLSTITVQSLADLGYVVTNVGTDDYTVANPNGAPGSEPGGGEKIPLIDDILWMPLRVVDDRTGQVVRVLPPLGIPPGG